MDINFAKISPKLYGMWIALADDKKETVLASGKTAVEALKKAQKKRNSDKITVARVPKPEIPNDDLLAAMKEADEYEKSGKMKFYSTVDEFMASLE